MNRNQKQVPANELITLVLVLVCAIALKEGYTGSSKWYWVLIVALPLLLFAIGNIRQNR